MRTGCWTRMSDHPARQQPGLVLCRHAGGLINSHDYTWVTISGDKVENWTEKLDSATRRLWSTPGPRLTCPGGEVTARVLWQNLILSAGEASFSLLPF